MTPNTKAITFRVTPELHTAFRMACLKNGVPMEKALREFVKGYVADKGHA